ncbi:Protein MON2 [Yarrowia sp. B02]|nr:Protein MON2 [Yarrowia sp. B02]
MNQQLVVELSSLLAESKRRHPDLRQAAEYTLDAVKNKQPQDLKNDEKIAQPLVLACSSRNAKLTAIAVPLIQRLLAISALSDKSIPSVLGALEEATHLGVEIQLKILQCLPTLMANYTKVLQGANLSALLAICSALKAPNKPPVVSNSAAATLQQLIVSVFDKVREEQDPPKTFEVPVDTGDKILVSPAADDALSVLSDLCSLIEHHSSTFLKGHYKDTFCLELVESILQNQHMVFEEHPELIYCVKMKLFPALLRGLSSEAPFPVAVRIARVLYLLLRTLLALVPAECEVTLTLFVHLSREPTESWERALCMEILQGVFSDFDLLLAIYKEYDVTEGRKNILADTLGLFRDLLKHTKEGTRFNSATKTPFIDTLDKTEAPPLPEGYEQYLAITCANSLCDALAKFLLQKNQDSRATLCKHLIDHSWSTILDLYSPLVSGPFEESLDLHSVIRAVQKLAHVAGFVDRKTARDAFMSLLATGAEKPPTQRAILCLRALVNLGTALGTTLGSSWSILLDTLRETSQSKVGSDPAVLSAEKKLLDSTKDYSNAALSDLVNALTRSASEWNNDKLGIVATFNVTKIVEDEELWQKLLDHLISCESLQGALIQRKLSESSESDTPEAHARIFDSLLKAVKSDNSEIVLAHLQTTNSLLQQLGKCSSWSTIFSILDTGLRDDMPLEVTKAAFDSVKLVCNDFLTQLPSDALLTLVDLLYKFCQHSSDSNLSFTCISLFWTVSDCILRQAKETDDIERVLTMSEMRDSSEPLALWLILMSSLALMSHDSRADVRNGAIQTFFRTFESLAKDKLKPNLWQTFSKEILPKLFLTPTGELVENDPAGAAARYPYTVSLLLAGFNHMMGVVRTVLPDQVDILFLQLLSYFEQLNTTSPHPEYAVTISKSFGELLTIAPLSPESIAAAWKFWLSPPWGTQYVSPWNQGSASGAIAEHASVHTIIYNLDRKVPDETLDASLDVLYNCLLHPQLPKFSQDQSSTSPVQTAVLKQISNVSGHHAKVLEILGKISKLSSTASKEDDDTPKYGAASLKAVELSRSRLPEVPAAVDDSVISLLLQDTTLSSLGSDSTELFLETVEKVLPRLSTEETLWPRVIEGGLSILAQRSEGFHKYEKLIFPILGLEHVPESLIDSLLKSIYENSLVWKTKASPLGFSGTLQAVSKPDFSLYCTTLLFNLWIGEGDGTGAARERLSLSSRQYAMSRAQACISQFINDSVIRGSMPIPKLQNEELQVILTHLGMLVKKSPDSKKELKTLFPLLLKLQKCGENTEVILQEF